MIVPFYLTLSHNKYAKVMPVQKQCILANQHAPHNNKINNSIILIQDLSMYCYMIAQPLQNFDATFALICGMMTLA